MEKEIKEQFKEVVDEGLKPLQAKIEEGNVKVAALEEKVSKLESLPAEKKKNFSVHGSDTFLGRKIGRQSKRIKELTVGNKQFETFSDEEQVDNFSKFMVAFIEAKCRNNPEAYKYLSELKAANQEGTDSEGGYLVPVEYQWDMVQLARNKTFCLNECDVIQMNSSSLKLPKELTLASVAWTAEEGQITSGEGTFDQVSLTASRLDGLATVSNELLQDSAIDVSSMLAEQFSYAILAELDNQVLAGTGSPVSGLMKGTVGTSVVMGSGSAHFSMLTGTEFSKMITSLEGGYMEGAKFVLHRNVLHYIQMLSDDNGRPIFVFPNQAVGGTIYGYPYIVSEKAIGTSAASTVAAVFGNLKNWAIGRRLGVMSLDVDPYGKFDYYQTRFRMVTRWGLANKNTSAFVSVVTAAS